MVGVMVLLAVMSAPQSPTVVRYRYEVKSTTNIDLTAVGQSTTTQQASTLAILSVTSRDSANGVLASVVIDSIVVNDGGAAAQAKEYLPPEMTGSGKGTVFSLYIVGGRIRQYAVSRPSNLEATAVSGAVTMIFPSLPPRVRVGDSWTDTTTIAVGTDLKASSSEINTWTLRTADTLVATVATATRSEVSAEMGTMTASGTGTRQLILSISQQVRSGVLTLTTSGTLGEVKIKGTTSGTLLRLP